MALNPLLALTLCFPERDAGEACALAVPLLQAAASSSLCVCVSGLAPVLREGFSTRAGQAGSLTWQYKPDEVRLEAARSRRGGTACLAE